MYKLFFIARNNIKKQKGDMITFLAFTLLASYLIFQCASALLGTGKVMNRRFTEVNGAHAMILGGNSEEETKAWTDAFLTNPNIVDFETVPFVNMYGEYRNAKDDEYQEYTIYAEPYTTASRMMQMHLDTANLTENDIIIPFYLKSRFKIGDTMVLRYDNNVYELRVAGYAEDPYFSSSVNITVYYCYLSQSMLDRITTENPNRAGWGTVYRGIIDQTKLDDGLETMSVEKEICESYLNSILPYMEITPEKNYTGYTSVNWHMIRGGAQFLPQVVMGIVLMFGVLILVIAFVIISHGVKNFIVRNMKNTGILEASGYTASMLRWALVLQIVLVALLGSLIGVGLGVATSGVFGNVVSAVLGLSWNQPVMWGVAGLTVLGMVLVTFLLAMVIGRVYKRITVLDALRGGINTHNYKKNHAPLDRTSLPLPVAMSVKSTLGNAKNSILLVVITAILAIAMACGFGMYESFGAKPETLLEIMGMEAGKVYMSNGDPSLADEYRKIDGVTNVLVQKGFEPIVTFDGKEKSAYTYTEDDVNHRVYLKVLAGRVPVHENEIMLTQVLAEDLGVKIGDVVTVKNGTKSADYIVTGFDQRMERMGRTMNLTVEGAERLLGKISRMDILISAEDRMSFEELSEKVKAIADAGGDTKYVIVNSEKNMESTMGTIAVALRIVCIVIAVITLLIVVFTETLIIRAKITREWRSMGISKALGATSGQLVLQIMLSNLPAVILGSVIGVAVSEYAGRFLCRTIFSLFGLKKIDFVTPFHWILLTVFGIVIMAAVSAALIGLRVRRMKPVEMITEE